MLIFFRFFSKTYRIIIHVACQHLWAGCITIIGTEGEFGLNSRSIYFVQIGSMALDSAWIHPAID